MKPTAIAAPDPAARARRLTAWLLLGVAIVAGASGTSMLPATKGFTEEGVMAAMVACYAVSFVALTRAVREIPVPLAYALWSGLGIVLVSTVGWVVYDQPLGAGQLGGIALILAGVAVIQLGALRR